MPVDNNDVMENFSGEHDTKNLNLTHQNQKTTKRSMGLILLKPKRFVRIPNLSKIGLEITRYSCGFAQSDRLNLRQIRAQILPSYFLPSPYCKSTIVPTYPGYHLRELRDRGVKNE